MLAVPPWALEAVVTLVGIAVLVRATDTGEQSGNSEEKSDGIVAAPLGFKVGGGGTLLL